jgi:hypothetical protein
MTIKSTVLQKAGEEGTGGDAHPNMDALKENILAECRRLFSEWLREQQER